MHFRFEQILVNRDSLLSNRYKHIRAPPGELRLAGPTVYYDMVANGKDHKRSELSLIAVSTSKADLIQTQTSSNADLIFPHSKMMETKASKKANDEKTESPPASLSQEPPQIVQGTLLTPKIEPQRTPMKSEFEDLATG